MKRDFSCFALILLPVLMLALAACGPGNSVRLLPPPPLQASSLPAPTAPSISIVAFTDDRPEQMSIGVRRDGSAFTTQGDVSQWISRALADQLARDGMRVTFANTTSEARRASPDYLVTGKIEEVWLKESSAMQISAQFRLTCALANRQGRLWSETCNTSQSKASLPSGSSADNLLAETLRDLIDPLAQKIVTTVEAKK